MIKKACIVDDDKLYVSLIKMLIKKNNLAQELLVFENGQVALNYFQNELDKENPFLPEVILLDLNMPIMDGWEFLDALEENSDRLHQHNFQLNVVSSTINPVEIKRATEHSIVHRFITKPITKDAMIEAFTSNN